MKKRIPNLDLYIETSDFNCTSTPTETNIEVGSRFVTCATRDGSGEAQTINGEKTFINRVIFQDNIECQNIQGTSIQGTGLGITGKSEFQDRITCTKIVANDDVSCNEKLTVENGATIKGSVSLGTFGSGSSLDIGKNSTIQTNADILLGGDILVKQENAYELGKPYAGSTSGFKTGYINELYVQKLHGLEPNADTTNLNYGSIVFVCIIVAYSQTLNLTMGDTFSSSTPSIAGIYAVDAFDDPSFGFLPDLNRPFSGDFIALCGTVPITSPNEGNRKRIFVLAMKK